MAYQKVGPFRNDAEPALSAETMNHLEAGIDAAHTAADKPAPEPAKATDTAPGVITLAGDLAGTADSPSVPKLADKVDAAMVTSNSTANTIALRGSQSQIAVGLEPPYNSSAASKQYVDRTVQGVKPPEGTADQLADSSDTVKRLWSAQDINAFIGRRISEALGE